MIIKNHLFVGRNRRTEFVSAYVFLALNTLKISHVQVIYTFSTNYNNP